MTITARPVGAKHPVDFKLESVKPDDVQCALSVMDMLKVMDELGQLSEFAADILSSLSKCAEDTSKRIGTLSNRVGKLNSTLPNVEHTFASRPAAEFYTRSKGKPFRRHDLIPHSLVTPADIPASMAKARSQARPIPPLHIMNGMSDEDDVVKKFSNPNFFFEKWLEAEAARQEKMVKDRKARKKRKKDKPQKARRIQRQAQAVEVKHYSAMGQEFADSSAQSSAVARPATFTSELEEPSMPAERTHFARSSRQTYESGANNHSQTPQPAPTQAYAQAPPVPPVISSGTSAAPPVPPPIASGFGQAPPVPPPVVSSSYGAPPVPPPVAIGVAPPVAPPVSSVPVPPPVSNIPAAPMPPPVPSGFDSASTSSSGPPATATRAPAPTGPSDLLAGIRAGVSLRSAPRQQRAAPTGRGGLLDEIRSKNFNLKKVDHEAQKKRAAAPASGMAASIMDILSRRQAIVGSDEDDTDSDDDWED
jgi:hypothetical protein